MIPLAPLLANLDAKVSTNYYSVKDIASLFIALADPVIYEVGIPHDELPAASIYLLD